MGDQAKKRMRVLKRDFSWELELKIRPLSRQSNQKGSEATKNEGDKIILGIFAVAIGKRGQNDGILFE